MRSISCKLMQIIQIRKEIKQKLELAEELVLAEEKLLLEDTKVKNQDQV